MNSLADENEHFYAAGPKGPRTYSRARNAVRPLAGGMVPRAVHGPSGVRYRCSWCTYLHSFICGGQARALATVVPVKRESTTARFSHSAAQRPLENSTACRADPEGTGEAAHGTSTTRRGERGRGPARPTPAVGRSRTIPLRMSERLPPRARGGGGAQEHDGRLMDGAGRGLRRRERTDEAPQRVRWGQK